MGRGRAGERRAGRRTRNAFAGVVYVNAIKKGAPAIFGTWPFVSDLRTGAMSGGSAEQALLGDFSRLLTTPSSTAAKPTKTR